MALPRIIPVLLLKNNGLYKTVKFRDPVYIGDPMNAVRVFNTKEVDEIILLNFNASAGNMQIPFSMIADIASQCFMPLCYGGGIRSTDDIRKIIYSGVEKIAVNTVAAENPSFVDEAALQFGSSSVVVSIDVRRNWTGKHEVCYMSGRKTLKARPVEYAREMEQRGAGELLLHSISNDGEMKGYDTELIASISAAVSIPVIACGGAGSLQHFREAWDSGASAIAAGSFFVFHGRHKGVLISYPSRDDISRIFPESN
jgi:cyclase